MERIRVTAQDTAAGQFIRDKLPANSRIFEEAKYHGTEWDILDEKYRYEHSLLQGFVGELASIGYSIERVDSLRQEALDITSGLVLAVKEHRPGNHWVRLQEIKAITALGKYEEWFLKGEKITVNVLDRNEDPWEK